MTSVLMNKVTVHCWTLSTCQERSTHCKVWCLNPITKVNLWMLLKQQKSSNLTSKVFNSFNKWSNM